ncbi:protein CASC3 isoform X1 [Sitophilus oryzae]|uniref:Protein CASC3 n=1 Tax=Sitophilus oryzae TaxID=7048 RepID=A0A6J2YM92_SITOR|nr:protein CASC3 isoform X1 [Sitophilus oryzae]
MDNANETVICEAKDPVKSQENPEISTAVIDEKTSPENSEYDSVDSYSDEEQPAIKARSKASGLDSHSDTEGSVILEREEGDGQESAPNKKVDDDEDKKNPQYIPKRGTFYEHDDRTAADIEAEEPAEADKDNKKKVWQDKKEKWKHDRFIDQEQAPKSRSELVAIYGYDIRNEDGPPRARRRRRYGRGPNKYTRTWEDEDAYNKPAPVKPRKSIQSRGPARMGKNNEEFPPLGDGDNRQRSQSVESNPEEDYREENNVKIVERQEKRDKPKNQNVYNENQSNVNDHSEYSQQNRFNQPHKVGSGRMMKQQNKKEIKDSDYKGFTNKTRQQRGMRNDQQKVLPPRNFRKDNNEFIQSQNFTNKNNTHNQIGEIEKEMSQMNIQEGSFKNNKQGGSSNQNRQASVPPRLQQSEQKGSKRYSSMRQRSLPETGTPPTANFSFYPSDYNSAAPPPASQQPILTAPIPPPALVAQQVPVTAAPPLLQAPFPPGAAFPPQPPPQAYLQAGPPPPFIAAPPAQPQIVGYVAGAQPPFVQSYQGQFNAVTQPTDLYQPQGGITYYSTDQQVIQRSVPQKRPKAAIPIVAPMDFKENKDQKDGVSSTNVNETQLQE